jgi:hypothetical protein
MIPDNCGERLIPEPPKRLLGRLQTNGGRSLQRGQLLAFFVCERIVSTNVSGTNKQDVCWLERCALTGGNFFESRNSNLYGLEWRYLDAFGFCPGNIV